MSRDINEFIDTLANYKAAISVALGTITMLVLLFRQKHALIH